MSAVWNLARLEEQNYPQLRSRVKVDTVVIGAGITGLSTALKLAQAGERVAVVEAHRVGHGTTGGSTGNLYSTLSEGLSQVREKWSDATVREVVELRNHAVNFVEDTAATYSIDCQFERRPLYFCVSHDDRQLEKMLEAEHEASVVGGLNASIVDAVPGLSAPIDSALRIEDQAQFNPLRYVQGLANAVTELGGLIFENSPVQDMDAGEGSVTCDHGQVRAKSIVQATHTPKGINLVQAEMEPYMEHGVAAPLRGSAPRGIFWMLSDSQSVRSYNHGGQDYLVVVGEKHKTGEAQTGTAHYEHLRNYARRHFDVVEFSHQWSAQQFKAADLLPYIGQSAHRNVYLATGFAADGLTWGTVAAGIISNQILGRESRGGQLFDPKRFTPVKSAKSWTRENTTVAKNFVKDYLTSEEKTDLDALEPGEGRLVKVGSETLAAYRDQDASLNLLSSVCPHMKCRVHWNAADSTWDCPCHGSRFATDGRVLEGPSYAPLEKRPLDLNQSNQKQPDQKH